MSENYEYIGTREKNLIALGFYDTLKLEIFVLITDI